MSKIIGILNTLTPFLKAGLLFTLAILLVLYRDKAEILIFGIAGFLVIEALWEIPKIHDKIIALEARIKTESPKV